MKTQPIGVALLFALAVPAAAHHSGTMFDANKIVAVSGTIRDIQWSNPHCYVFVNQELPNGGGTRKWLFEAGPPDLIARMGFSQADFKVGAQVTAHAHPARSGQPVGNLIDIAMPNGRLITLLGK